MSSLIVSHKSDINSLVSHFLAQLKRREISGSHSVALSTANLLLRFVSASRWSNISQLISEIRALGKNIVAAQPKEFASGNVVRRVLAVIREVAGNIEESKTTVESTGAPGTSTPLISSMFGLLSTNERIPSTLENKREKQEKHKDQKADIIEGIQEVIDEIGNMDDTIAGMSVEMIHESEVLLTPTPGSKTVLEFLLRASQKRKFTVLVAENFPNDISASHEFARKLAKAGIETIIIPDTMTFAVMARVGKVIIGTRTVLANGGCLASSGVALTCECAREYNTPVLAVTGLYKLSPLYPFDIESLIEVGDTGKIVSFSDGDLMDKVQVMNPTYDYIAPENINIYITNIGGHSPSFTYRIVLDYYSNEDVSL
jgi:translation initiation factor eIF-2B subunit beta